MAKDHGLASMASAPALRGLAALTPRQWAWVRDYWFLALAGIAFALPGLLALGRIVWTTEQGAHGPIILATGLWLLVREAADVTPQRGRPAITAVLIAGGLVGYLFATVAGMVWLRWLATYVTLVGVGHAYLGMANLRRLWFPLFYLLFLVPPPFTVLDAITGNLRLLISSAAVNLMAFAGYNVASSGVTLFIDGYELLVAAACSGMNSIISLLAIGLFYIYLQHRAEWTYAAILAALVIPIAILANLVRVLLLMLITHYLGMEAAQGFLHEAAGMVMFFIALFTLILVDGLFGPLRRRLRRRRAAA